MSQIQLDRFYTVTRSGKTPASQKRTYEQELAATATTDTNPPKRPAHIRFANLATDQTCVPVTTFQSPRRPVKVTRTANSPQTSQAERHGDTVTANSSVVTCKPSPAPALVPSTSTCVPRVPAHERFADLVNDHELADQLPIESLTPSRLTINSLATDLELTQTTEELPPGLTLPHHLRLLLELFRSCDTVVSMLHNRLEMCSFDKLRPAVQEVVRRNFEESHIGQFLAVYPMVYVLRYDKQLDKYLRRPTGNHVLVLVPNLRTDGTQLGHDSPSKGHIIFTGTRLIQRRKRFHRLLLGHVFRAHREFLQCKLGIDASQLPDDKELRRWHPRFCLDTMVPVIQPAPLPVRPSAMDSKITTAKDAVKAFQARSLFRDADVCQNVANLRYQECLPPIPSPTKLSACSPRKPPLSVQQCAGTPGSQTLPSIALFKSSSSVDQPATPPQVANSLKGVSEALLAKVRARENERRLLTMLAMNTIPESRRAIYARLPSMITQVWTVMRPFNGRPVPMTTVASRVADAHPSGLSADAVNEHLKVLLEVCPTWLQKVNWSVPHLCMSDPSRSVKDVIDWVKIKLADEGFQF
ncbi:replication licensing factor Cdt1 [Clonorchis sinensis]|uniref:Replication licensing factor Cdt1 n=1 Tax=Clonorchis sinensis TaxID=79923 RepID=A0A8T1MAM4_CLOSI|nr:replication licensing factor Cdt1 [Clonorchis sinensis]